ncbi:MAG: leucine--tRNA ligase [Patescibacteria group bacterium]|jgi:leucyl-tRNA synthetase
MKYDFPQLDHKWQKIWADSKQFNAPTSSKSKKYVLDMFPYPSGDGMHIGHVRIYTASDVLSKYLMMNGHSVLHPTGWDAFGLPAENYAIKHSVHPTVSTSKNISNIKRQMSELGFGYNWDREINTTNPEYYKWTQWIFIQLYKAGLAYEADVPINWCPKDKTGLANEEVINGKCERCGTLVEKRNMRQWMLKITAYADRLLADLDQLDWPEHIITMQRNWIGKSNGATIKFRLEKSNQMAEVFTTRLDTLFGATYVVLAPEHPLVGSVVSPDQRAEVERYIKDTAEISEFERIAVDKPKTGVFSGTYAINPVNDAKIPIWIANYVLPHYGTGAIMAVPAHDERDYAFAQKHQLPIISVIKSKDSEGQLPYVGDGVLENSGEFNGLTVNDATKKIVAKLSQNHLAELKTQYKLRDWVFSRQRYWGEPIPIIHCDKCGAVPVPDADLPVKLPEVEKYEPTGTGESPLAAISDWVNVKCPKCGGAAKRETNTMPQWAGSCWYYLRFIDPQNKAEFASQALLKEWLPVDCYLGGAEHAVLHLLYARFWHKFLFDQKLVPTSEPFQRLESVGIVLANAYKDSAGRYVHISDVVVDGEMAFHKSTSEVLTVEVEKMSKSKGNVVSPDDVITKFGADALRVYMMFIGSWNEMCSFDIQGLQGSSRFLYKAASLSELLEDKGSEQIDLITAKSVIKVTSDIEKMQFNTAISQLMIFANHLSTLKTINVTQYEYLLQLLAPFAPHLVEELWQKIGHDTSIFNTSWPKIDPKLAIDENVTIVVQVNGKVRSKIIIPIHTSETEVVTAAKQDSKISPLLNQGILKVIYVPDKLVNIVTK